MRISDNQKVLLGPPGTGKSTYCLDYIEYLLSSGVAPEKIAFVSFTKKAIGEAVERASDRFGLKEKQLPMFKTIHALCFAALGIGKKDVISDEHYREFGEWLGYRFEGTWDESEGVPIGSELGDTLLFLDNFARITKRSLRDVWEENYTVCEWEELERFQEGYQQYKSSKYVMDFTDMLDAYLSMCEPAEVDYAIIDEAQDLSPLQWDVVKKAFSRVKHVLIAGDDDQSIFKFSGACVDSFLALEGDKHILSKSYRLPRSVHAMANGIVSKIINRFDKPFSHRGEEGEVGFVDSIESIEIDNDEQSTLILVRNNFLMGRIKQHLERIGIPYIGKYGRSSIRSAHYKGIQAVEDLASGKSILGSDAKAMYECLHVGQYLKRGFKTKSANLKDSEEYTYDYLKQNYGLCELGPWYSCLTAIGQDQIEYLRRTLANGYALAAKPNVVISTVHGAKGGEADHVVLLGDMANKSHKEYVKYPDNERRVAYVAVTRARSKLTIVRPSSKYYFDYFLESQ